MNDNSMDNMNEFVPDHPGDTIVGNLIADVLSKRRPPDLTSRILARYQNIESNDAKGKITTSISEREREAAALIAENDIKNGYAALCYAMQSTKTPTPSPSQWFRKFVWVVSTVAAILVIGICIGVLVFLNGPTPHNKTITEKNPSIPMDPRSIAKAESLDSADSPTPDSSKSVTNPTESELNNSKESRLANAAPVESELEPPQRSPSQNVTPKPFVGSKLTDEAIVDVINEQFQQLWSRTGVAPKGKIKTDEWIERATVSIIGRQPTAAERESFRANRSDRKEMEFIEKLLNSGEFARHWADVLAEHYLGNRVIGSRNQASPQRQFINWLADSISKRAFIGDVEREMISGKNTSPDHLSSLSQDPAAFWIAELLEPAELETGNLTPSPKSKDPKLESQMRAARQLFRVCGNTALVCAQCHQPTVDDDAIDFLAFAPSKDSPSTGTIDFWRVTAILSGFSFARNERTLKRSPPVEKFFYDDADGRLQLVAPGPPSNRNDTDTSSLGDWMAQSIESRNAFVDMVWSKVFGQPLVPVFGLTDDEGKDERIDLRDMLASQMQAGQRDVASLIRWMVQSRPFRVEGVTIDTQWYLRTPESQLAESQRNMRLFASSAANTPAAQEYGKIAMNRIINWIEAKKSFDEKSVVAQADGNNTSSNTTSRPKLNYSEDQIRFLVSVTNPYSKLSQLAERLANSQLSTQELTDHTFLISDARFPLITERESANKVFELSGKDRKKAILMLIQGRLGPF